MLQPEGPAAYSLKAGYYVERAERFRSAKLDGLLLRRRMAQRNRADFCDIAVRNPTNWARSRPIDASLCFCVIESQSRAQPYFHKPARLYDGEVHAFDGSLNLLLRIGQRERYPWRSTKRDKEKPVHIGVLGCAYEAQLSYCVHR